MWTQNILGGTEHLWSLFSSSTPWINSTLCYRRKTFMVRVAFVLTFYVIAGDTGDTVSYSVLTGGWITRLQNLWIIYWGCQEFIYLFFFLVESQVVNTFDLQTSWPLPQVLSLPLINKTAMAMLKACIWCSFSHNLLTSGLITMILISGIIFSCWQLYIWISLNDFIRITDLS